MKRSHCGSDLLVRTRPAIRLMGKELGVRDTTVFKWRRDMEQVAWERLKDVIDAKGVTWECLLEGL